MGSRPSLWNTEMSALWMRLYPSNVQFRAIGARYWGTSLLQERAFPWISEAVLRKGYQQGQGVWRWGQNRSPMPKWTFTIRVGELMVL